jgi:hypothetical protein
MREKMMIREFKRVMERADLIGGGGGTPPEGTPPEGTPPEGTPPEGTPPEGGIEIKYPENFPKEFHGNPTIMKHANKETGELNVANIMTGLIHASKLVGEKGISKPSEGASEAEMAEFYHKLGNPKKVEDYKIEVDGFNSEDPISQRYIAEAHKAGVNPKQAAALYAFNAAINKENAASANALGDDAYATEVTKLKADWGNDFDKNAKIAETAFTKLFNEDDQKQYKEAGLLTDPAVIKMLKTVGSRMLDDDTLDAGGGDAGLGNAEAMKQKYRDSYSVIAKGDKTDPNYVFHQKRMHSLVTKAGEMNISLHT